MLWGAGVGVLGLTLMVLGIVARSGSPVDGESLGPLGVYGAVFGSLGGLFLAIIGGLLIPLDTDARIARRRAFILTVIMTPPLCLGFYLFMQPEQVVLGPLVVLMVVTTVLGCLASRAVMSMSGPWTPHGPVLSSSA